jgi:hypothetical protein
MMLAAGLGPAGYVFAIAHLITHGFFKAGLFLGAGSVKHSMNDEVDMRRFGALRVVMPITSITFLFGYLAIIGVPPFSGFFTKDPIIEAAFDKGGTSGAILGTCALVGAGITAFYMTRVVLMTFTGERRWDDSVHPHEAPPVMTSPMVVLALGSLGGGMFLMLGNRFVNFLSPVTGAPPTSHGLWTPVSIGTLALAAAGARHGTRGAPAGGRRAQGPVRGRGQRSAADAAGAMADPAVGVLRQPGRGRPGQHGGRDHRRHVGPDAPAADRFRPVVCPVHVPRRGAAGRRPPAGETLGGRGDDTPPGQ